MPTASNMPMPVSGLQGLQTGFGMGDQILKNLLARQQAQRQQEQFNQDLALKQLQENRLQRMLPLQEEQIRTAIDKTKQMLPYESALKEAQSKRALSQAGIQNLLLQMIQGETPQFNGQLQTPLNTEQSFLQPIREQQGANEMQEMMQPNQNKGLDILASMFKFPIDRRVVDGKEITYNPLTGTRERQVAPTAYEKELAKQDIKIINDLDTSNLAFNKQINTYDELKDVVTDPLFAKAAEIPFGIEAQRNFMEKQGNPEMQQLLGRFNTLSGQIIADSARIFPGQFRIGEQALLNSMKPNKNDSVGTAIGKLDALNRLAVLNERVTDLMSDYMRKEKISAPKAFKKAKQQIKADQELKQIKNSIPAGEKKEWKELKSFNTQSDAARQEQEFVTGKPRLLRVRVNGQEMIMTEQEYNQLKAQ